MHVPMYVCMYVHIYMYVFMCELMYEGIHYDTTAHPGRVPSLLGHCYNLSLGKVSL